MNFKTRTIFSTMICMLMVYVLLIGCIKAFAMNRNFYNYEYGKLNTAEKIGMSEIDLYEATDTLLDYLEDYRDDINVKVTIDGEERAAFDTRETIHMVDVKNLYQSALFVSYVCIGVMIGLLLLLVLDNKKGVVEVLTYTYQRFFLFFAFALGALIVYALSDFTTFWTYFHKIFFSNDLWLLDPKVSVMINMFPEQFFSAMVFGIAGSFFAILILLWIYSIFDQRKRSKV